MYLSAGHATIVDPSVFLVAKTGLDPASTDDAACWNRLGDSTLRVAIADGATEAIMSGRWAQTLVETMVTYPKWPQSPGDSGWIRDAADRFSPYIQSLLDSAPWYVTNKALDGSFATILGLELSPNRKTARFVGVGDSCAAVVTPALGRVAFFPEDMLCPLAFHRPPNLVASASRWNQRIEESLRFGTVDLESHIESQIYLMTDALAAWFVNECSEGGRPWEPLNSCTDLALFVDRLRQASLIRDDDTSLVRIRVIPR